MAPRKGNNKKPRYAFRRQQVAWNNRAPTEFKPAPMTKRYDPSIIKPEEERKKLSYTERYRIAERAKARKFKVENTIRPWSS